MRVQVQVACIAPASACQLGAEHHPARGVEHAHLIAFRPAAGVRSSCVADVAGFGYRAKAGVRALGKLTDPHRRVSSRPVRVYLPQPVVHQPAHPGPDAGIGQRVVRWRWFCCPGPAPGQSSRSPCPFRLRSTSKWSLALLRSRAATPAPRLRCSPPWP